MIWPGATAARPSGLFLVREGVLGPLQLLLEAQGREAPKACNKASLQSGTGRDQLGDRAARDDRALWGAGNCRLGGSGPT